MENLEFFTKSYTIDPETYSRLEKLAKEADRPISWIIRSLVNQEFERSYSQVKPAAEPKDPTYIPCEETA
jgi:predicted transcriptional regulator